MRKLIEAHLNEEQRYDAIMEVLREAYVNETLHVSSPCGCAVGNLIAAATGYTIEKLFIEGSEAGIHWIGGSPVWSHKFFTMKVRGMTDVASKAFTIQRANDTHVQVLTHESNVEADALWQLEQTGLGIETLMGIEWNFELGASRGSTDDEQMFLGLMAVSNYLEGAYGLNRSKHQQTTITLKQLFTV